MNNFIFHFIQKHHYLQNLKSIPNVFQPSELLRIDLFCLFCYFLATFDKADGPAKYKELLYIFTADLAITSI